MVVSGVGLVYSRCATVEGGTNLTQLYLKDSGEDYDDDDQRPRSARGIVRVRWCSVVRCRTTDGPAGHRRFLPLLSAAAAVRVGVCRERGAHWSRTNGGGGGVKNP